jgi:hypothetical protein
MVLHFYGHQAQLINQKNVFGTTGDGTSELESLDCLPRQQSLFRFCFHSKQLCTQQPRGVRSRRSPSQARGGCAATGRRMLPHHRRKPCMPACLSCCRSTATFAAVNITATAAVARSSVNAPVEYWQQHLAHEFRAIGCRSHARRCLLSSSHIPLPLKPPNHLL